MEMVLKKEEKKEGDRVHNIEEREWEILLFL